MSIKGAGTSMDKGETLKDTIRTLEAYDPDVFVVRHPQVGACDVVARHTSAAVVNAGDGTGEHPTQALLDLYTVQREIAPVEGLHVAFVGDVLHSRVARSGISAFRMMGAKVTVVAPPTLVPRYLGEAPQGLYLIRPDQHIAARWPAYDETAVKRALARATGKE